MVRKYNLHTGTLNELQSAYHSNRAAGALPGVIEWLWITRSVPQSTEPGRTAGIHQLRIQRSRFSVWGACGAIEGNVATLY